MSKKKLLYICGMGHNGSTVMNLALNMSPQVVGAAQLNDLLNPYDPYGISPSERTDVDNFWIEVLDTLSTEEKEKLATANRSTAQEKTLMKMFFSSNLRNELTEINTKVVNTVLDKMDATVLVDSSKNVTRAIALTECEDIDVYFLHLIRDVRGLVNSHNKRRVETSRKKVYLKSTLHWLSKNCFASLLLRRKTNNVLKVNYEQVVMEPDKFMDRLESFLGESLPETRASFKGEVVIDAVGMGFGGNRVLRDPNIRFRTGKLPKDGVFASNLYWYSLGWLSKFWGYRRRQFKT